MINFFNQYHLKTNFLTKSLIKFNFDDSIDLNLKFFHV